MDKEKSEKTTANNESTIIINYYRFLYFFFCIAHAHFLLHTNNGGFGKTEAYIDWFMAGRPGSSEVPRNPLTRWDVSSIPANGIFLAKKLKNKIKMPNGWRTIKSLVHKIRLHS